MSNTYRIAVIPGDGTGTEVVNEGRKALQAAAEQYGFNLEMTDFDFGGDRYLRTGEVLPETAVDELFRAGGDGQRTQQDVDLQIARQAGGAEENTVPVQAPCGLESSCPQAPPDGLLRARAV